uniref:Uncharacterized protein n=1 Tax=Anguilla anguilla TaxID=7936 RepID=A0A0E9QYE0_ANGAN
MYSTFVFFFFIFKLTLLFLFMALICIIQEEPICSKRYWVDIN